MNNVSPIAPQLYDVEVPEELRELSGWLIWRFEKFDNEPKPRKVPYWADGTKRHGQQGGPVDRARLTTFVAARDAAARMGYDGVGFAPLEGFGYTFLDFDNCVDVAGRVPSEIEKIAAITYTEYSPSGKGLRVALRGDLGNRKSNSTPERYGFETFSTSGFVTFTGNILPACEMLYGPDHIADVDDHVRNLCEVRFGSAQPQAAVDPDDFMVGHEPRLGLSIERMQELLDQLDPDMGRDDWIKVGMSLHHECDGDDTGFEMWDDWSSGGATYPGTEGLRAQWDSFERRAGQRRRQVTMATVIKMAKDASARPNQAASVERVQQRTALLAAQLTPTGGVFSPPEYQGKFPIFSAGDMSRREPPDWLIRGVIPKADLFMLYGASGSGKSFAAIDLAAHVALGLPWRGQRVERTKVVIVAAEGGGGYGLRIKAWCQQHDCSPEDLDIGIITVPPNMMESDDVSELAAVINLIGGVGLILIDTLAQVTPGANENSSEDMGLTLSNCRTLGAATGAVVGLVHHAGKDLTRGARGWSGARAAVDAEIEVTYDMDSGVRMIRITKQKDGRDGMKYAFKLGIVALGFDRHGDDVTSCVALETDVPVREEADDKTSKALRGRIETHVLEVMALFPDEGAVPVARFINKAVETLPPPEEGARDTRRQKVMRAIRSISAIKGDVPLRLEGGSVVFYD